MNLIIPRCYSPLARTVAFFCAAVSLFFVAAPPASAASLITPTHGTATSVISSVVFNPDSTVSIEADQIGSLSNVGTFTGHFSYRAVPTPVAIIYGGSATLVIAGGDKIFLTASIVALGADYPRTVYGALTIRGGTGHYKSATGTLLINGIDDGSLTNTITIHGSIVTPKSGK